MNYWNLFLACIISVSWFSCNTASDSNTSQTEVIETYHSDFSAGLTLQKKLNLDESVFKIGRINPYAFVTSKKYIYILDMHNEMYVKFDENGAFMNAVGNKGRGPGELTEPRRLFADSADTVYIFDMSKFATVIYDQNDQFIKEVNYRTGNPAPGGIKTYQDRKVICLFDPQDNSYFENVNLFHLMNDEYDIINSIEVDYPAIYKTLELGNYILVNWEMNEDYIFVIFPALPDVYKYDFKGNLVSIFKADLANHKSIDKKISKTSNPMKRGKKLSNYSNTYCIYLFDNDKIFVGYYNTVLPPDESYRINSVRSYRKFYYYIVTTSGEQIRTESELLPGEPLFCSADGSIYMLTNNEPDNREISVYNIQLEKN